MDVSWRGQMAYGKCELANANGWRFKLCCVACLSCVACGEVWQCCVVWLGWDFKLRGVAVALGVCRKPSYYYFYR